MQVTEAKIIDMRHPESCPHNSGADRAALSGAVRPRTGAHCEGRRRDEPSCGRPVRRSYAMKSESGSPLAAGLRGLLVSIAAGAREEWPGRVCDLVTVSEGSRGVFADCCAGCRPYATCATERGCIGVECCTSVLGVAGCGAHCRGGGPLEFAPVGMETVPAATIQTPDRSSCFTGVRVCRSRMLSLTNARGPVQCTAARNSSRAWLL